ncbi:hypothetical protein SPOG_00938 [Schizosaccharomyces cryophilus OY26]|uniref:Uncharacterized protein n=1 Tax=Schizosaccharomyces cryophilus (strain OY26 / ATCC MYA-4695 / CBS 11777 / NBRC 106824 / NRRL Y48691) TaxID=653667 RepID=S9WZM9_SCHCR|nr:uncharacterized protein SPOG_00938 [Schizosaccharomyces cryophilus OY26]EPY50177.1 hypothetical protein SPOG_00938 [Schizosaccharomyces cryophilus OY26]
MLLHFGLSALLFTGTTLASMPYNNTGNSNSDPDNNKPIFQYWEEELSLFPTGDPNVQAFAHCDLLVPFYDNISGMTVANARLQQKECSNGTAHILLVGHEDLFQAYKHAIDGNEDYRYFKNFTSKPDEDLFDFHFNFTDGINSAYYMRSVNKPGTYCFLGLQEVEPTENGGMPEPIMYPRYQSALYKDRKPEHRIFFFLSVFSSLISLVWLIRWLRNYKKNTFTQILLFVWYAAFLLNHPIKRTFFSNGNIGVPGKLFSFIFPAFSYLFGDGVERPLFNSLILALSLGLGYYRRSSKKLVFLIILLGFVQSLFIVIAPMIFPILLLTESPKAKPLQLTWMLFNYGYLPSILVIRVFHVCRMRLKLGHDFDDKYIKSKKFLPLLLLAILVSVILHVQSAPTFNVKSEVIKTCVGVMYFYLFAFTLNAYNSRVLKDDKAEISEKLQKPLPLYKDDSEMELPADEKLQRFPTA